EKYASYVTGNRDEAVNVLQAWVRNYPNDYVPHNNLAVDFGLMGRSDEALKEAREAVRLSPNSITGISNYLETFIRLNRFDEARETLEQLLGKNHDRPTYRFYSLELAVIRGDQ